MNEGGSGEIERVEAEQFINTMALRDLIERFDPPPPEPVRAAAAKLRYPDFLIVTLIIDHAEPFPDNWIYIPELEMLGLAKASAVVDGAIIGNYPVDVPWPQMKLIRVTGRRTGCLFVA